MRGATHLLAASSYSPGDDGCHSRRNVGAHNFFWDVVGEDRLVAPPFAESCRESTLRHIILFSGQGVILGTFALLWGAVLVGDRLLASPFAVTVLGLLLERRAAE